MLIVAKVVAAGVIAMASTWAGVQALEGNRWTGYTECLRALDSTGTEIAAQCTTYRWGRVIRVERTGDPTVTLIGP